MNISRLLLRSSFPTDMLIFGPILCLAVYWLLDPIVLAGVREKKCLKWFLVRVYYTLLGKKKQPLIHLFNFLRQTVD